MIYFTCLKEMENFLKAVKGLRLPCRQIEGPNLREQVLKNQIWLTALILKSGCCNDAILRQAGLQPAPQVLSCRAVLRSVHGHWRRLTIELEQERAQRAHCGRFWSLFLRRSRPVVICRTDGPPPAVICQFGTMYNTQRPQCDRDSALQQFALETYANAVAADGHIEMQEIEFDESSVAGVVEHLGRRRTAPGLSGVTYRDLAAGFSAAPDLVGPLMQS